MRSKRLSGGSTPSSTSSVGDGGVPGKRTLVQKVYAARSAAAEPEAAAPEAVDRAAASDGAPLPAAQRGTFERSLGTDLSSVRVHTDDAAVTAAGAVGARAYAVDDGIYFGADQYQPGTADGDRLLAHEVAHTVQQRGSVGEAAPQAKLEVSSPGDAAEVEADAAAEAMVSGAPATVTASAPVIARQAAPAPAGAPAPGGAPAGAPAVGAVVGTPTPADITAADGFAGGGALGPQTLVPSTGMGGFDATYTPTPAGPGRLQIDIHAAVNFVDPIRAGGGGRAVATHADYQPIATAVNRKTPAERAALIAQCTWSTAAADRQAWMDQLKTSVESTWSARHEFHIHRAGWDWIGSAVSVDVTVAARTARDPSDHVSVDAVKMPPNSNLYSVGMFSWCAEGDTGDAHDQTMRIASTDVIARPDDMLGTYSVLFGSGSAALDGTARSTLTGWVRTFQGDPSNPASHAVTIEVEGFASRSGTDESNLALSEQRVTAVVDFLRSRGFTNVASRTSDFAWGEAAADQTKENPRDRRVDISIQHEGAQVLAAHEFGHAFGLGDQYATKDKAGRKTNITGTGSRTGEAADHDALTQEMLDDSGAALPGAIYENNDSIMSGGNVVRAEHYSTFAEALRKVSGVTEWALGPPHARASVVAAASGSGSTSGTSPPTTATSTPAPQPGGGGT